MPLTTPENLFERLPVPKIWGQINVFKEKVQVGSLELNAVGVSVETPGGETIMGSTAGRAEVPDLLDRAYYELLERASIIEAVRLSDSRGSYPLMSIQGKKCGSGERERVFPRTPDPEAAVYARSNGVALYTDRETACRNAYAELVERDRVLRSWYGGPAPERCDCVQAESIVGRLKQQYEMVCCRFRGPIDEMIAGPEFASDLEVSGVFLFPRIPEAPMVYGFAGAIGLRRSFEKSLQECLQRLAFLWGEPVVGNPDFAPNPSFHQELFLGKRGADLLRRWLDGEFEKIGFLLEEPKRTEIPAFVDLTPEWLQGKAHVVKALDDGCLPLLFGRGYSARAGLQRPLPDDLVFHPIA